MRTKMKLNIAVLLTCAATFCVTGCEDAKNGTIDSRIYIAESTSLSYESKKVMIDEAGTSVAITPRSGKNVVEDTEVELGVNAMALDVYNAKNGTNYLMLPEESYSFEQNKVIIKKGETLGGTVKVNVNPLSKEMADSGNKYALPIAIISASGGEQMLKGADVMIYIMDQVIITNAPVLTGTKTVKLKMTQDYKVTQWSLEMRIKMDELGDGVTTGTGRPGAPSYQNQVIFSASSVSGLAEDGEIYIRFGDAPIPGNILQVKTQGTQINATTKFKAKEWYHLAFVCTGVKLIVYVNGNVDATLDLPQKPLHLSKNSFSLCGSAEWMVTEAMFSEVRFWSTAISQSQIQNNMYSINPSMEGLEGYWRMNEGAGKELKDATGHGNQGVAESGVVRWVDNVRSDGKGN